VKVFFLQSVVKVKDGEMDNEGKRTRRLNSEAPEPCWGSAGTTIVPRRGLNRPPSGLSAWIPGSL
jgi:hypothetical protein